MSPDRTSDRDRSGRSRASGDAWEQVAKVDRDGPAGHLPAGDPLGIALRMDIRDVTAACFQAALEARALGVDEDEVLRVMLATAYTSGLVVGLHTGAEDVAAARLIRNYFAKHSNMAEAAMAERDEHSRRLRDAAWEAVR